jgi:hypothetical protein
MCESCEGFHVQASRYIKCEYLRLDHAAGCLSRASSPSSRDIKCEKCDWKHGHGGLVVSVVKVRTELFRARLSVVYNVRESLIGYRGMRTFSILN